MCYVGFCLSLCDETHSTTHSSGVCPEGFVWYIGRKECFLTVSTPRAVVVQHQEAKFV